MDFSLNRDKKNTAEMLPFNLLIKIANATSYKVDLDPEGLQSSQVKHTPWIFHEWIYYSKVESVGTGVVVNFRFISAFLHA